MGVSVSFTLRQILHALERDLELEGVTEGARVVQNRHIQHLDLRHHPQRARSSLRHHALNPGVQIRQPPVSRSLSLSTFHTANFSQTHNPPRITSSQVSPLHRAFNTSLRHTQAPLTHPSLPHTDTGAFTAIFIYH